MRKLLLLSAVCFTMVALACAYAFTCAHREDVPIQNIILASIEGTHYSPLPINDDYSKRVFHLFFKHVDYNKRFYTQQDIDFLKKYETQLDDEAVANSTEFAQTAIGILNQRIVQAQRYSEEAVKTPFTFDANESIETDPLKIAYAKDSTDMKEQWRKDVKFQVLQQVYDMNQQQVKAHEKNDTVKIKSMADLEVTARGKVGRSNKDYFRHLREYDYNDWMNVYLNCLANVEDPHTEYFPPAEKQDFDVMMSGQLQGIGAQLQEKDGSIKVTSIVIGSPSWHEGHLKAGDEILKVAQGDQEPVDIEGMRLDKAVQLIRGKKGTEVRLTVRKSDATTQVITIIRDIVVMEDSYAKSMILKTGGHTLGYIFLPEFYANFGTSKSDRNCADDVRKELVKLKSENVEGIIIDLRNNGGGSLYDCVHMAGLFIDKGPVVQVRSPKGAPEVLKDEESGMVWDGPLAVMVNKGSASASEIFSAALQDYKRAIIIGGNTYGKGTVQRFLNLDDYIQPKPEKSAGSIKITMQKFYRINGSTTQLKGVTPDITLPDATALLPDGEKDGDYPLSYDKIEAATYNTASEPYNQEAIVRNSERRVAANSAFELLKKQEYQVKEDYDHSLKSLNYAKYSEERKAQVENKKNFDELTSADTTKITVTNLPQDLPRFVTDTVAGVRNKAFKTNLKKDVYLFETTQVVEDMMNGITKKN